MHKAELGRRREVVGASGEAARPGVSSAGGAMSNACRLNAAASSLLPALASSPSLSSFFPPSGPCCSRGSGGGMASYTYLDAPNANLVRHAVLSVRSCFSPGLV